MSNAVLTTSTSRFPELPVDATYEMLIGGEWGPSGSGAVFRCVDPYEDVEWGFVPEADADDVDRAVRAARAAFPAWSALPAIERSRLLTVWSGLILEHAEELARIQVHENGKTITEMRGATRSVAVAADHFGHLVLSLHGTTVEPHVFPGHEAWTRHEPMGVIAAITPWNNPIGLLSWKLFPALAAGNTIVIKPSEVTPVSTLELARLGVEAGIPAGVINVVTGAGVAGRALAEHPGINKVAFTGSTATGRAIATAAAARFVRTTLELGGKGANIVFADADLDKAVAGLLVGLTAGTGQACNAGSRILVASEVYDEVVGRLRAAVDALRIGDPLDPAVQIGPLASRAQFRKVCSYFDIATEEGHDLVTGGSRAAGTDAIAKGLFVEPTLYDVEDTHARLVQEEIFGPVGAIIRFDTEADAVRIANDIDYGLVAGLWTRDVSRAHRMARKLESGTVWINTWRAFSNNVPFGGVKLSGVGREIGLDAIAAYTETKAVWLRVDED